MVGDKAMVDTYRFMVINGNTRWYCENQKPENRGYYNPLELYDDIGQPPPLDELAIIPLPKRIKSLNGRRKCK